MITLEMWDSLAEAGHFAKEKHKDQKDDNGKDYFDSHLVQVFSILESADCDEDILMAGLLHDTLEDTDTTYEELKEKFGERVANLVHEVTHEGKPDRYGYYFPRLKSRDAVLIKLADRMSNLLRMDCWDQKRQAQYLKKTKFWRDGNERK